MVLIDHNNYQFLSQCYS